MNDLIKNMPIEEKRQIHTAGILTLFLFFVSVCVYIFLQQYSRYNDQILYEERLSQMQEVTTQLFICLEDVVANRWETVAAQSNHLEEAVVQNEEQLLRFMQRQTKLAELKNKNLKLMAVDSLGRYYTQSGLMGAFRPRKCNRIHIKPYRICDMICFCRINLSHADTPSLSFLFTYTRF